MNTVCFICHPSYPTKHKGGGRERFNYELLSHLRNYKDLQLKIITPSYKQLNNFQKWLYEEMILFKKVRKAEANLFYATSPLGAKTAALTKKFPLITTIHDVNYFLGGKTRPIESSYSRICTMLSAKKSSKIIATSYSTKRYVISLLKISPQKIVVARYGVDHQFFSPLLHAREDQKKILFMGRGPAYMEKGSAETLIKVFFVVQKKLKNIKLLVGGNETKYMYLKKMIYRLRISKKINFVGFIPEKLLPAYYNLADAYIWVSNRGFGLSILEAMACGTPVIATNAFDTAEYLGDAGILVKPHDVKELSEAILKVLTDEELRHNLIKKGIERAKMFSWEKMAKEVVNVYYEVI